MAAPPGRRAACRRGRLDHVALSRPFPSPLRALYIRRPRFIRRGVDIWRARSGSSRFR
jgi:hypothetical protein